MKKHFGHYPAAVPIRLDTINTDTLSNAARVLMKQMSRKRGHI